MAYAGGLGFFAIVFMQLLELVLRNAFGISIPFVWEYAAYLNMAAIFLSAAYTLRTGGHIQVSLLKELGPKLFAYLSTLIGLLISLILSYALIRLANGYAMSGRTSGTVNDLPLIYPAAAMAFGASLLSLQLLFRLVHIVSGSKLETHWQGGVSAE
jgi:TRAP-type C4-dicarboxylate transport system permease small subunit